MAIMVVLPVVIMVLLAVAVLPLFLDIMAAMLLKKKVLRIILFILGKVSITLDYILLIQ